MTEAETTSPESGKPQARRKLLMLLGILVVVGVIAYALWRTFLMKPSEQTDDAYVNGHMITVTARDPGTVVALYADDTERVRAGQPLVDLDPATADANVAAAAAELGRAVRGVRAGLSQVDSGSAAIAQAEINLARAEGDFARRRQAAAGGAVSGEDVAHATDAVKAATAALQVARGNLATAEAQVQGTGVRNNPAVQAAIANYRLAAIQRSHMHIVAPVAGTVARRAVQIGQKVAPGAPLMAVVPLEQVWVDANFRETQLAGIRVGQPVQITTDIYGSDVVFHGRVIGMSAGSGNAFALLPPQNATGNWIKIVQRVPVRIALDPKELRERPLLVGLSVIARVDTSDRSGTPFGRQAGKAIVTQPATDPDVEADISRIIAANAGRQR